MDWVILRSLDDDERRAVLSRSTRRRFRNGDTLFHQGDLGDSVHLLERGHVAIRVLSPRGTAVTLDVLVPGSSFGEQALLDPASRRTATAVAIGQVETRTLGADSFAELQRRHPAVTMVLVELLAAQVRRLSDQLLDAHTMGADERVLKQLARLAASFGDGHTANIPITQEDLASLAGTTRPTANRALQALVDDGTVVLGRGRIEVVDSSRL